MKIIDGESFQDVQQVSVSTWLVPLLHSLLLILIGVWVAWWVWPLLPSFSTSVTHAYKLVLPAPSLPSKPIIVNPTTAQPSITNHEEHVLQLVKNKQLTQARAILQARLVGQRASMSDRLLLVEILLNTGETSTAQQLLGQMRKLSPHDLHLLNLHAQLYAAQRAYQKSLFILLPYATDKHTRPEILALIASNYFNLGQFKQAADYYQRLTQHEPSNGRWWYGLGTALQALQHTNDAMAAFEHSLVLGKLEGVITHIHV